jgi:hypothetical protein
LGFLFVFAAIIFVIVQRGSLSSLSHLRAYLQKIGLLRVGIPHAPAGENPCTPSLLIPEPPPQIVHDGLDIG